MPPPRPLLRGLQGPAWRISPSHKTYWGATFLGFKKCQAMHYFLFLLQASNDELRQSDTSPSVLPISFVSTPTLVRVGFWGVIQPRRKRNRLFLEKLASYIRGRYLFAVRTIPPAPPPTSLMARTRHLGRDQCLPGGLGGGARTQPLLFLRFFIFYFCYFLFFIFLSPGRVGGGANPILLKFLRFPPSHVISGG